MVEGTEQVVAGRSTAELIDQRDRRMIAVMRALAEVEREEAAERAEGES